MKDKTTEQLIERAANFSGPATRDCANSGDIAQMAVEALVEVIRRQQARLAALEAARAPHGPPLEGTGPLPLERRGA